MKNKMFQYTGRSLFEAKKESTTQVENFLLALVIICGLLVVIS
jgi:hypothetical protein